jgi:hypothetical protein
MKLVCRTLRADADVAGSIDEYSRLVVGPYAKGLLIRGANEIHG